MNITIEQRHATENASYFNPKNYYTAWSITNFSHAFIEVSHPAKPVKDTHSIAVWLRKIYAEILDWRFSRRQSSAFAFIAVGTGEQRRYLLQWNEAWHRFNLIGGKLDDSKGDGGSMNRALQRELEEELGLKNSEDFKVGPCLKTVKMRQFSRRENKSKQYRFDVFDVALFPQLLTSINHPNYAARWLSTRYENVFASAEEITNLITKDGRAISRTTRRVLQELGELA
ncbi:MAG: NUDIX hydrolase [Chloroflexota bacterium]|jgi:8-oxo-dGTP pyrophosphatase MutT (NUDIX family)